MWHSDKEHQNTCNNISFCIINHLHKQKQSTNFQQQSYNEKYLKYYYYKVSIIIKTTKMCKVPKEKVPKQGIVKLQGWWSIKLQQLTSNDKDLQIICAKINQ